MDFHFQNTTLQGVFGSKGLSAKHPYLWAYLCGSLLGLVPKVVQTATQSSLEIGQWFCESGGLQTGHVKECSLPLFLFPPSHCKFSFDSLSALIQFYQHIKTMNLIPDSAGI